MKTNDQLGKVLVSSGLIPVGDVKSLWAAIPAEQRPKDGKKFAELLIAQSKLTMHNRATKGSTASMAAATAASTCGGNYSPERSSRAWLWESG